MTAHSIFQVDAFTDKVFKGNPAGVCPIYGWLADDLMSSIARENNLSETAFVNLDQSPYGIRWFTPKYEVELCGHATLAAAKILFDRYLDRDKDSVSFISARGPLSAKKIDEKIYLDFPADFPNEQQLDKKIVAALNSVPKKIFRGQDDYLAIFEREEEIALLTPNLKEISRLEARGVIASAPGTQSDFVSRCFYPSVGVDEDPVTGSAHTLLTPYWEAALSKKKMLARQISARGGQLFCELHGDRVMIGGEAVTYLVGKIYV